jgi:hypothetical protein
MAAAGYGNGGPHDSDELMDLIMDDKNDTLHEFIEVVDV